MGWTLIAIASGVVASFGNRADAAPAKPVVSQVILDCFWIVLVGFAGWCLFRPTERSRAAWALLGVILLLFAGLGAIYMRRWS